MSLLRSQSSQRLCRAAATRQRISTPQLPRHVSQSASHRLGEPDPNAIPSDSMQSTEDQATMITVEEAAAALPSTYKPSHQPDWNVTPDHGTSYASKTLSSELLSANFFRYSTFSPVPKRVMDGSEPGEVVPGAILSGAPVDLQGRQVRLVLLHHKR